MREEITAVTSTAARGSHLERGELGAGGRLGRDARLESISFYYESWGERFWRIFGLLQRTGVGAGAARARAPQAMTAVMAEVFIVDKDLSGIFWPG